MNYPDILSLVFYVTSAGYFFLGIKILSFNFRSAQHRVLFLSFTSLTIWSFAFALATNAPDIHTALLWRRIAVLGWGVFYSLFLNYVLLITEKHKLLKKYWIYPFLYMPAAINVYLYGINDRIVSFAYDMLETRLGWVNSAGVTIVDIPHLLSYISFSLVSIFLLVHWGINTLDKKNKKIAFLIGSSGVIALSVGTLNDVLSETIFRIDYPQLAPVIILLPMLIIFYCTRRYGFMETKVKSMVTSGNQLLSGYAQSSFLYQLSYAFYISGFISFLFLYYAEIAYFTIAIAIASLFFISGNIIFVLRNMNLKTNYNETVTAIVIAIALFALTVMLYEYTDVRSPILPLAFILSAIVFYNSKLVLLIGVSVFLSLAWSWIRTYFSDGQLTNLEHAVRFVVFSYVFAFVFFINKIFKHTIAENQKSALREKLLSDIATSLMNVNENNIDTVFRRVAAMWGNHLKADNIDIMFFEEQQNTFKSRYHWSVDGELTPHAFDSKWEIYGPPNVLRSNPKGIHSELPKSLQIRFKINEIWKEKIKEDSLLMLPIKSSDRLIGVVSIASNEKRAETEELKQKTNSIAANIIADAWLKTEADLRIRHEAFHDNLTGLANRKQFKDRLSQAINMASRTKKYIGVFMIDIDSFKSINDVMGHDTGDLVLQQIAITLSQHLREYDVTARFGGDEFLVFTPQIDEFNDISQIAAKLLDTLKKPLDVRGHVIYISSSIGISVYPVDGDDPETLIKNADIAMYSSKEIGKNRFVFCSASMKINVSYNAVLSNDLHTALDRNELYLNYQPQMDLASNEITGTEALLRWNHPRFGLVPPNVFIPLSEKGGQISKIGAWIIKEACLRNKEWQDLGFRHITIAVNLSLVQLMDANLVLIVKDALAQSKLKPEYLELEITESIATYDYKSVEYQIRELKALGVKISIDDFGAGYSSLDRLKNISADKLKIDMKYVHGIGIDRKDEELIKVIVQIGKTFGLRVLAEGVEQQNQLSYLKDVGCEEIQGFLVSKPVSSAKLLTFLKTQYQIPETHN